MCDFTSGTHLCYSVTFVLKHHKKYIFLIRLRKNFFVKMPHRCVVFGCSNTSNLKKGIALHRIPYANDKRPEANKRRKAWVDFVKRKRKNWQPSSSSEVCSKHFKEDDFVCRYTGEMGVCNSEKPLLVAPTLKRDSIGICVWPSKFKTEETVLSERDRRRIVSIKYFLKNSHEWFSFSYVSLSIFVKTIDSSYFTLNMQITKSAA